MKLTKYEHACFTVEKDGQVLVVDPGGLSPDFIAPENVVAVIVTHEHFDHYDHEQLATIIDKNQDAIILAPTTVVAMLEALPGRTVAPGESITVGPFGIDFFGGQHATIHAGLPPIANLGVLINGLLYYPGDSFTLPGVPVDTLALPASAPWMKISEAIDFLSLVKPRLAFPTHDAILSEAGKDIADSLLEAAAGRNGCRYIRPTAPLAI
jgi:L-ascorbate metabolism protein UlaG (beta-lactamase superfamily)